MVDTDLFASFAACPMSRISSPWGVVSSGIGHVLTDELQQYRRQPLRYVRPVVVVSWRLRDAPPPVLEAAYAPEADSERLLGAERVQQVGLFDCAQPGTSAVGPEGFGDVCQSVMYIEFEWLISVRGGCCHMVMMAAAGSARNVLPWQQIRLSQQILRSSWGRQTRRDQSNILPVRTPISILYRYGMHKITVSIATILYRYGTHKLTASTVLL
jgi:hypothetical protein